MAAIKRGARSLNKLEQRMDWDWSNWCLLGERTRGPIINSLKRIMVQRSFPPSRPLLANDDDGDVISPLCICHIFIRCTSHRDSDVTVERADRCTAIGCRDHLNGSVATFCVSSRRPGVRRGCPLMDARVHK